MTIQSVLYSQYAPERVKIDSLAIGIDYETLNTLNFTSNQYLIVGQHWVNITDTLKRDYYSLVVDEFGIGVNTNFADRSRCNEYSLYVDGDVFVTGNIRGKGVIGTIDGNNLSTSNYWIQTGTLNNIYYPGNITLGNQFTAENNTYTLSINQPAGRTIEKSQLSIQNTHGSQFRVGIIGAAEDSPVIVNTPVGQKLEFHIGRDQGFFQALYNTCNYNTSIQNVLTGNNYTYAVETATELPMYDNFGSEAAPQLQIDSAGNIGIHTSANNPITYLKRIRNPLDQNEIVFRNSTEVMTLQVEGSTYAKEYVMFDRETQKPRHLDDLYIRRLEASFPANQILTGAFAPGSYWFPSNVGIGIVPYNSNSLTVNGDAEFLKGLKVNGVTETGKFIANEAIFLDIASFSNDIYTNRDIYAKESVKFRGGLFHEILSNVTIDGACNMAWRAISFQLANLENSNINYMGQGITTPGRFGAGISPWGDEVNNQTVINKRDPEIFELELKDLSSTKYTKVAFIGHPSIDSAIAADASLVFATPRPDDGNYAGVIQNLPQNFYFFPGFDLGPNGPPIISPYNPPTLGIFANNRVSINKYAPTSELDVNGTITFSGALKYDDGVDKIELGLWKAVRRTVTNVNDNSDDDFLGIQYYNSNAPNVGINIPPESEYALSVGGRIKTDDAYYIIDNINRDRRLGNWLDSTDNSTTTNNGEPPAYLQPNVFTWGNVGVGVKYPVRNIDIKDPYNNPTSLRLTRGNNQNSCIEFAGNRPSWIINANDSENTSLQIALNSNTFNSDTNDRALWMRYNNSLRRHQVVIGCNMNALNELNTQNQAILTVGGNMNVLGDMNVTGVYRMNGSFMVNNNITTTDLPSTLNDDDVYIGGGHIVLYPAISKTCIIGNPNSFGFGGISPNNEDVKSMLRVYQSETSNTVLATFRAASKEGLIKIVAGSKSLKFGVLNYTNSEEPAFGFLDENDKSYISFKPIINGDINSHERGVGFNTITPTSIINIYSEGYGSNMLRLTKKVSVSDNTSASSELDFEKIVPDIIGNNTFYNWSIKGPNSSYGEKLGFNYKDPNTPSKEIICITNNGCLGIGNSTPEYSLDIASIGNRGSLRLLNTGNDPNPQILFQTGSNLFGKDDSYDYMMYAGSSNFRFIMQNINNEREIINVNNKGYVGIGMSATSNYNMSVNGILNVTSSILLNGSPIFSVDSATEQAGVSLRANNIFIRPVPSQGGGVVVNNNLVTTNLFHIFSGSNNNLMVYDSRTQENQIHYRTVRGTQIKTYSMWRNGTSNNIMYWEHDPNNNGALAVSDTHVGYHNAMDIQPTIRDFTVPEYDLTVYGNTYLKSSNANVWIGDHAVLGSTQQTTYLSVFDPTVTHIGIGTTIAYASIHLYASNTLNSLLIEQNGNLNGDLINCYVNGQSKCIIDYNGNIGIGTTPNSALEIATGVILNIDGDKNKPAYSFRNSPSTGIYSDSKDSIKIATGGNNRVRIDSDGNVNLGTYAANRFFNVSSNTSYPLTVLQQSGSGDILNVINNNGNNFVNINSLGNVGIGTTVAKTPLDVVGNVSVYGSILPTSNEAFDLGSSSMRWKDLYLSGNSINLSGTSLSKTDDGDLLLNITGTSNLTSVICKQLQIGYSNFNNKVLYISGDNTVTFTSVDLDNNTVESFSPLLLNNATQSMSLGTDQQSATLNVVTPATNYLPTMSLKQLSSCNIVEMYNSNQSVLSISKDGETHFSSSNSTFTVNVEQLKDGIIASFANKDATQIVFDNNGNVGIHTTVPTKALHVVGQQYFDGRSSFTSNVYIGGNLEVQGNTVTHGDAVTDSDIRLKSDLCKIENALDKIDKLTGYTFNMHNTQKRHTGLVAQEVLEVLPEAVQTEGEYLGIAYGNLMGLIIEGIKELRQEIKELKKI